MPRAASAGSIRAVLAACDRESAGGRRDYAILLVMARLALRGGEVAGLDLGDVDWRAAEVTVRGKGNRTDVLPLPLTSARRSPATSCTPGPRPRRGPCS